MPAAQAADAGALAVDAGALVLFGDTSGIDDETGGALARGATDADDPAGFGVAFGLAPAQAAASTRTDRVNVSARRMSGP